MLVKVAGHRSYGSVDVHPCHLLSAYLEKSRILSFNLLYWSHFQKSEIFVYNPKVLEKRLRNGRERRTNPMTRPYTLHANVLNL